MPPRFKAADADVRWSGVDDDTPPGHSVAIGKDGLGNNWLWLFKGDKPSERAFVGAVEIPAQAGRIPAAYGRGGGFVGLARDTKEMLAKLAARAEQEG
ncbi:hypothetical protein [Streptomyces sp. NPDC058108]|uniref:hypothetical protein n=1 Tax=Streptomyces sp. NPDC058108 TaxID=3346344 RepID=UPI0036EA8A38